MQLLVLRNSKHTETTFSPISTNLLCLQHTQMPRSRAILVPPPMMTDYFTPYACAQGTFYGTGGTNTNRPESKNCTQLCLARPQHRQQNMCQPWLQDREQQNKWPMAVLCLTLLLMPWNPEFSRPSLLGPPFKSFLVPIKGLSTFYYTISIACSYLHSLGRAFWASGSETNNKHVLTTRMLCGEGVH